MYRELKPMWAIRNKRTGKWLYGTDRTNGKARQRTSYKRALLWDTWAMAQRELHFRCCNRCYEVVPVNLVRVED